MGNQPFWMTEAFKGPDLPRVGEKWRARGMWEHESESDVTIIETIFKFGSVDVRYEDGSERILPAACLIEKIASPPCED